MDTGRAFTYTKQEQLGHVFYLRGYWDSSLKNQRCEQMCSLRTDHQSDIYRPFHNKFKKNKVEGAGETKGIKTVNDQRNESPFITGFSSSRKNQN